MIRTILTDIEGTTTAISFVHQTLFPYSAEALPGFIQSHWEDEALQSIAEEVAEIALLPETTTETVTETLLQWIREDKKLTPLKALQGMIWVSGYESGKIKGHLYDDAHQWLKEWSKRGIELAVFSSGSIKAQKLLFQYSQFGDLTSLFSNHFDTTSGSKQEAEAYENIRKSLEKSPEEILFLSDVPEELDAAKGCGMLTAQLVRAEDGTTPCAQHPTAKDFHEIEQLFFKETDYEHTSNL